MTAVFIFLHAGAIMKNIRQKIVTIMILCTLLSVAMVGFLSINTANRINNESSVQRLSLLSDSSRQNINSVIDSLAQSVSMLQKYALNNLTDPDKFREDASYVNQYTMAMKPILLSAAQETNGAMSVYLRYNPDFTEPTSGIFMVKNSSSGDFEDQTPTDFSKYDPSDTEHVGWYYIPVGNGKATWMPPYQNQNIDSYMISYVIPLLINGKCYGIVGMDIDFSLLQKMVDSIKIYDSGYAFLLDSSQNVMIYPDIAIYTPVDEIENGSMKDLFTSSNINRNDLTYTYKGEQMSAAVRELNNGMILVLAAPKSEIFSDSITLTREIIMAALVSIAVVTVISLFVISRMMKPAVTDALTNINNRQAFLSLANSRLSSLKKGSYAFIMLDLDHFKQVNDTYGHEIGDHAIQETAESLKRTFAATDILGRFGGDEFLIFMECSDRGIVEKRLHEFQEMLARGGDIYPHPMTCSIGVVFTEDRRMTADELLVKADTALYKAKENGRNCFHFFS